MVTPSQARGEDRITTADAVRFVRQHGPLALGGALLVGLVALGVLTLFVGPIYRATATLIVLPPGFSSELDPDELTVQAYQRLLESDAVLAETERRLSEREGFDGPERLRLGEDILSQIFISRRQDTTSLAPMLELVGRADSPAAATTIANTWAEVFLEMLQDLATLATSSTVSFLESEFPRTREQLEELEKEFTQSETGFRELYDRLADTWDARLAAFHRETTDVMAAYRVETRTAIDSFMRRQLELVDAAVLSGGVVAKALQLAALRTQLAQASPIVILEKGITEDALWQTLLQPPLLLVGADGRWTVSDRQGESRAESKTAWRVPVAPMSLPSELLAGLPSLTTEEQNPIYGQLILRATELENELQALAGAEAPRLAALTSNLEKWQEERSAGLAKLLERRRQQGARLKRQAAAELEAAARERAMGLDQLARQVTQVHTLADELATHYNEAVLARSEEQQKLDTVHLAASAMARNNPEPRRRLLKTLLAAILGGVCGLLVSVARHAAPLQPGPAAVE